MDDGRGHLREISEEIANQIKDSGANMEQVPIFKELETIEIRGSKFQVMKITGKRIELRILPRAA